VIENPFSYSISPFMLSGIAGRNVTRRLSDLRGYFADAESFEWMVNSGNPVAYEVVDIPRPERGGELISGLSILYPGTVGSEYFMTKGHFHAVRETSELYYCLAGSGLLLMENEQGESKAEALTPGRVVYVAPGWAHRSVNTGSSERLVTFFVYPAHAGHDYRTIEERGFRKRVVNDNGRPRLIDNDGRHRAAIPERQ
jgi:glucose-6-phosphate isomerase